jgi:hypothetical protein
MRRANKDMAQITEALLLLSRKNSNQTPLEYIHLNQLIQVTIDEHRYLLENKSTINSHEVITVDFFFGR